MLEALTVGSFVLVCLVSMFRTSWTLSLLVVFFPFKQALQASSGFFISNNTLPNYIVALIVAIAAFREATSKERPFLGYLSFQFTGAMLLLGWSVVSLVWTPSREMATEFISINLPYAILFVILGPMLIRDVREFRSFLLAFLPISSLVAVVMLLNPTFTSQSGRMGVQIAANLRTNPLAIGELGGVMIIVASLIRSDSAGIALGVARAIAMSTGAILAIQSGSRGQIAFAVLVAILCFPAARRVRSVSGFFGATLGSLAVAGVVLVVAQYALEGNLLKRWDAQAVDEGVGIRLANLFDLLSAWLATPAAWLFGLGFNAFSSLGAAQAAQGYTHNLTADILAELGLPIFCVYLMLIAQTFRSSTWLIRRFADEPSYRSVCAIAVALAAYQLLLANKQGMLWASPALFLSFITISRLRTRESSELPPREDSQGTAGDTT